MPGLPETMSVVRLPRPIVEQLRRQTKNFPDEEVCGLISRDRVGFKACYPVANTAADKKNFFVLDPKGQIEAMRTMRAHGEELAAIYHSHPEAPLFPSLTDIEQHEYPGVLYLIISLGAHDTLAIRGFDIQGHEVREIAIGPEEEIAS